MNLSLVLLLALAQPIPQPALAPTPPLSVARLDRVEDVRKGLGLSPTYDGVRDLSRIRIAVLDYGFDGIDGKRPYLPADAVLVENYDAEFVRKFNLGDPGFTKGFEPGNVHGRLMAQVVWGATGSRPEGPKFYLLNANGPTMFRRAVRYAIEAKVDVLLFSAVFEGGGNYDGQGPYAKTVDEAIAAGILWVNAAGNFGGKVHNGPMKIRRDGNLILGSSGNGLEFRNRLDENTITITLTWNDYRATEDAGTTRDLDLVVEDPQGKVIARGDLRQVETEAQSGAGKSLNPRERVTLPSLGASEQPYRIRIEHKGGTFTEADSVRVLLQGSRTNPVPDPKTKQLVSGLEFLDASKTGEVYPPADHPRVITVGDLSLESSIGPTSDHRVKPDVLIADASATFTNGELSLGSSNAAAYFAAIAVTLKAAEPRLTTDHLIRYANGLRGANKPQVVQGGEATGAPAGLREVTMQALTNYGYGPIIERVQQAAGREGVKLYLNAEGRVVLGVTQRPIDLAGLFPNHPFAKHEKLSNEYDCFLSLQPAPRGGLQVMDSFRLKTDSPYRPPGQALPRVQPQLVEIRQVAPLLVKLEERTRETLLNRRWTTPGLDALANLVRTPR